MKKMESLVQTITFDLLIECFEFGYRSAESNKSFDEAKEKLLEILNSDETTNKF